MVYFFSLAIKAIFKSFASCPAQCSASRKEERNKKGAMAMDEGQ